MANRQLSGAELINPYDDKREKAAQVEQMFDSIAPAYDFMNTAMTFGLHRWWRKRALNAAAKRIARPASILDVATGTGDVAFDLHHRYPNSSITGIDLSEGMLKIARQKLAKADEDDVRLNIRFIHGDSLHMPFADNSFDLITVAYGVRNFEHLDQGLAEMARVLRHEGIICIIELSEPEGEALRSLYRLYARHLIPFIGRLVSGDSRAYSYLPESIAAAPQRKAMTDLLTDAGFKKPTYRSLTAGAVTYYLAEK